MCPPKRAYPQVRPYKKKRVWGDSLRKILGNRLSISIPA